MLGQYGFLAEVFSIFDSCKVCLSACLCPTMADAAVSHPLIVLILTLMNHEQVSVDVVASSDVSLSLTLDKKQRERDIPLLQTRLKNIAEITCLDERAIVSLICNTDRSSEVMATAFKVCEKLGYVFLNEIKFLTDQMLSQRQFTSSILIIGMLIIGMFIIGILSYLSLSL